MDDIERNREVPLTFTWMAPRNGVVLERNVVPGMRVMPGEVLFRIADHTAVWALVDVASQSDRLPTPEAPSEYLRAVSLRGLRPDNWRREPLQQTVRLHHVQGRRRPKAGLSSCLPRGCEARPAFRGPAQACSSLPTSGFLGAPSEKRGPLRQAV
jgi:hypothetical protein